MTDRPIRQADPDEPPPILGSWRNVYLLLAGQLVVLVLVFWALTRWASS